MLIFFPHLFPNNYNWNKVLTKTWCKRQKNVWKSGTVSVWLLVFFFLTDYYLKSMCVAIDNCILHMHKLEIVMKMFRPYHTLIFLFPVTVQWCIWCSDVQCRWINLKIDGVVLWEHSGFFMPSKLWNYHDDLWIHYFFASAVWQVMSCQNRFVKWK